MEKKVKGTEYLIEIIYSQPFVSGFAGLLDILLPIRPPFFSHSCHLSSPCAVNVSLFLLTASPFSSGAEV